MWSEERIRGAGLAAVAGGVIALVVTPFMVLIKYSAGWSIVPEPAWARIARPIVEPLVSFATPVELWIVGGGHA